MPNIVDYYAFLVQLTAPIRAPLIQLSYNVEIPFLAALVLGMIGALSPYQLSTNVAVFTFISRNVGEAARVVPSALAYLLGKVVD